MTKKKIHIGSMIIPWETGLSEAQRDISRKEYGRNVLSPPPRVPWWKQLLEKFDDPTIKILLVAAVISLTMTALERFVLGQPASFVDSIGIFLAVALATLVGFFSERNSAKAFDALNRVKEDIPIEVLRDGHIQQISILEILVGDLVRLGPGNKISADGILLESFGILVDESILTGESVPAKKVPTTLEDVDFLAEYQRLEQEGGVPCESRVYRGTMINDGHGLMLVTAVGDVTEMGKIARELAEDESKVPTPLAEKLTVLAQQISVLGISAAMLIFMVMTLEDTFRSSLFRVWTAEWTSVLTTGGISVLLGVGFMRFFLCPFFRSMNVSIRSWFVQLLVSVPAMVAVFAMSVALNGWLSGNTVAAIDLLQEVLLAFIIAVTVIVVAVPEGLPMMVTVSLALNMLKMAKQNCLVRKLIASETIGSATVICSDKTGTLTENQMRPVWFFASNEQGNGMREYAREAINDWTSQPAWEHFARSVSINSTANLDGIGERAVRIGNPTECAILAFLSERGMDYQVFRKAFSVVAELPHNSQRKLSMVAVDRDTVDGRFETCLKGAPERVWTLCSEVQIGESTQPIAPYLAEIRQAVDRAAADALRVLAVAYRVGTERPEFDENALEGGFVLIGLIGIADPLRAEVPHAVETCTTAGIQVKMITGDALPTAVAIAKDAGILTEATPRTVLTSVQLAEISDEELPERASEIRVLARSTPSDKLRLVKALQRTRQVVAMTGDGTNDAPALKHADVGLSMGISGTEVAKEASDIVLVDDNFKSIVTGVLWGRTLYRNIQRFLQFQLSVNVVALVCATLGPLVGVPLPLTVTQLLWINIIMDTFAALAYSTDPPRSFYMTQKPIQRDAHIITRSMGFSILANSLYQSVLLFWALYAGWFLPEGAKFTFYAPVKDPANLQALTVFFTIFVMFQFWHRFNCRSLYHGESVFLHLWKNRLFLEVTVIITVVQAVMVQASEYGPIGEIFRTVPLSGWQWLGITLMTATILPFAWICRQMEYFLGLEKE